jgi:hypothetical protein
MTEEHDRPDWLAPRLRELPRELEPGSDLWPGIAARLASQSQSRPRRVVGALAAGLVLGAVIVLFVLREAPAGDAVDPTVVRALDELRAPYGEARARYAAGWVEQRTTLDPDLVAVVERNLAIIRSAQVEIDRAIAQAPDNRALRDLLHTAYASELDVYRRVQRLRGSAI